MPWAWVLLAAVLMLGAGGVLGVLGLSLWRRTRRLLGEVGRLGDDVAANTAGTSTRDIAPAADQAGPRERSEA